MRFWRRTHSNSRSATPRRSEAARSRKPAFPLRLEALEDRTLLAAGALDPSFGIGGRVVTEFPGSVQSRAHAVTVQPDGKMLAVGETRPGQQTFIGVVRYNQDGTLDNTFGSGGRVSTPAGDLNAGGAWAFLQRDGKLLVVGSGRSTVTFLPRVALVRYNPDGSLDTSFGTGGIVLRDLAFGGVNEFSSSAVQQPDGRVVLAGTSRPGNDPAVPWVIRFNADGTRDTGFSAVIPQLPPRPSLNELPPRLLLLPNGKILLSLARLHEDPIGALVRLNADGSSDRTFGNQGMALTRSGGPLALLPDGRILAGSYLGNRIRFPPTSLLVSRYLPDGSADPAFGDAAVNRSATDLYPGFAVRGGSLIPQTGGKLVVAGGEDRKAVLARLDPNGFVDPLFGVTAGRTFLDFHLFSGEVAAAVQADEKIVVAGGIEVNGVIQFSVVRLLSDDPITNANERFLTQLYVDVLRRAADAAGLGAFVAALDAGRVTRTQVTQVFTASAEYREVVVRELYRSIFRREADPGSLTAYVRFLGAGGTVAQLKATLLSSVEYVRPRETNERYVTALYFDVLGREPEPAGRGAFVQALNAGVSHTTVAAVVLQSPEALERLTRGWYTRFLRRPAEPAGVQAFVAALQGGMRDEVAISIIVGSEEYLNRL